MACDRVDQLVIAWLVSSSELFENVDGWMEFWSDSVDEAEAQKADDASITTH